MEPDTPTRRELDLALSHARSKILHSRLPANNRYVYLFMLFIILFTIFYFYLLRGQTLMIWGVEEELTIYCHVPEGWALALSHARSKILHSRLQTHYGYVYSILKQDFCKTLNICEHFILQLRHIHV